MTARLPDPRLNAYRADLAAASLRGKVDVPRFSEGKEHQVVTGAAPLRREPRPDAALETELLRGETLLVYDEEEGWAWAQAQDDSYVGYIPAAALSARIEATTHRVSALRTYLYPQPDIKAPPLDMLSMNARVAVVQEEGRFMRLGDGSFAASAHLAPASRYAADFVAVAERFIGTPYLWGGRTSLGLDCSGLIQLSLQAAGIDSPRDTDMQEAALGEPLADPHDRSAFRRADLVFWKGHMGVMLDRTRLLHANAYHMAVGIEPVSDAIERIAGLEGPVSSVRRMGIAEAA